MAVEGRMKCIRYLLFFSNSIFCLCGLALVVLAIVVQVSLRNTYKINGPSVSEATFLLIEVGILIFFISFFGCCGAFKENDNMVRFAILLSLIIIIEITAAIFGYIFIKNLSTIVQDSVTDMMNNYDKRASEFKDTVDQLQQSMKCCGGKSSADWKGFASDGKSVPDSCCVTVTEGCGAGTMHDSVKVFQKGCTAAVEAALKTSIVWEIVAALVITILQLLCIVVTCILMKASRSRYEVMYSTPEYELAVWATY